MQLAGLALFLRTIRKSAFSRILPGVNGRTARIFLSDQQASARSADSNSASIQNAGSGGDSKTTRDAFVATSKDCCGASD